MTRQERTEIKRISAGRKEKGLYGYRVARDQTRKDAALELWAAGYSIDAIRGAIGFTPAAAAKILRWVQAA